MQKQKGTEHKLLSYSARSCLLLTLLLAAMGCGQSCQPASPATAGGGAPQRIISLAPSLTAMRVVMEEIVNWQQGRFDSNPHFQATLSTAPEPRVTLVPRQASWGKMIRQIELTLSVEQAGVMKRVRMVEDERSFTELDFSQVRVNRSLPASLFEKVE